jgi:predicted lipoprotein with Yx(FWY)xxD motif
MLMLSLGATVQAAQSRTSPALVRLVHNARLGQILVRADSGRTLYHFSLDRNGRIGCTGPCLQFWFPLLVTKGTKVAAIAHSLGSGFGVINRGGGQMQVTYRQQPLYTFILDQLAGQTNGQGYKDFGGVWMVPALTAASSSGKSGGNWGGNGVPALPVAPSYGRDPAGVE